MDTLPWEAEMLRVYIGESDIADRRPLYQVIVERARERGMAGVTVMRGIAGFGAASRVQEMMPKGLSQDAPIIVEIVDRPDRVRALLAELTDTLGGCLITLQQVRVLAYRPNRL